MLAGQLVARRYLLDRPLGAGGRGVVWLATDRRLKRPVALKRAHIDGDLTRRAQRRMREEATNAARVPHPHVITLMDVAFDRERRKGGSEVVCWLVMEYLEARTLAQLLHEKGPLSPRRAVHIAAQLASALEALHGRGLVHGDIKPGNVLVTAGDAVKVIDFGSARFEGEEMARAETGVVDGTPAYMAPEAVWGAQPTRAADVFSLGATLYAALVGTSPYGTGETPQAMASAVRGYRQPPPACERLPVPGLAGLLAADPERRPTVAEARLLLLDAPAAGAEQAGESRGPSVRPRDMRLVLRTPPVPSPDGASVDARHGAAPGGRSRWCRRRAAAWVAGLAVAALAILSLIPLLDGDQGTTEPPADPEATAAPTSVVGVPTTADPCSLVDPAPLGDFGWAQLDRDHGNFDRCDVLIELPNGTEVDVLVDLANPPAPEDRSGLEQRGWVGVRPMPGDNRECGRYLLLADGYWLWLAARNWDERPVDLCAIADVATDYAVARLNAGTGQIARRSGPFPEESLARQDACALIERETFADVIPGLDPTRFDVGVGNWSCEWGGNGEDYFIALDFDRADFLEPDDGQATQLGGYTGALLPEGDGVGTCVAQLEYRPYVDDEGAEAVEKLHLTLSGPGSADALCQVARDLLTAAGTSLPRL